MSRTGMKVVGLVLLLATVGVVSCQALFAADGRPPAATAIEDR